ncbi:MAG: OprO/OprP family phosphate-selective porin [Candidatus Aegiribacteria sp.]|nr:OprO/OprP family phosphate-selective porin [Candidatus Aegiribacteria sp.]
MKHACIRILLMVLLITAAALADVDVENDRADSFTLSAYARIRFSEFGGALTIPNRSFGIESAGLTADFGITDNIKGQLQLETRPDEIFLKDCYILWESFDFLEVQAGRFKKPFCLNTLTSTWDLQAIAHSISHRELSNLLYSGRDIGSVFIVNPDVTGLPELSLGVFNGSPDWINQDNEIQYVGRAEFELPCDIVVGADLTSLRFGEEDEFSVDGYICSSKQVAIGGDLQLETKLAKDFSLLMRGEIVRGDNWANADVINGEIAPEFQTWWFTGGISWKTEKPSLESISASLSMASWKPDRSVDSREDELIFTVSVDTGTPVTIRAAMVNHRPHNIIFEEDRTDYILEAALDL